MRGQTTGSPTSLRYTQAWVLCVLMICSFLLPNPGGVHHVAAQERQAENEPFGLAFVPRDAVAVIAARPEALLNRPVLAPLRKALLQPTDGSFRLGVGLDALVETSLIVLATDRGFSGVTMVKTKSPEAAKQFIATLGQNPQPATFADVTYYRVGRTAYFLPDPQTIVMAPEQSNLIRCIAAGPSGASTTNWAGKWSTVAGRDAAAVVNTSLLRAAANLPLAQDLLDLSQGRNRNLRPSPANAFQLAPLWQRSESFIAELRVSNDLELRVVSESATDAEAEQVHGALLTTIALARSIISQYRLMLAERVEESTPALMAQLDLVDEILEKAQIARKLNQVGLVARADRQVTQQLVTAATPAVLSAQRVGYRNRSMNNLKQIALAFHNYHDTYRVFPAAVQIGPKNIPHSWRVTILPFIEGLPQYMEYRQDEPWDSETNRKVLAQMPAVYRSPNDQADSTNTSYFALAGDRSVFDPKRAIRFADIVDGTSNTLLLAEARQPVPWTKPQDIAFDAEGPLPELGGWYPEGFCAALCDGSTFFVPKDMNQQNLRYLIMRDDGNPVRLPNARR